MRVSGHEQHHASHESRTADQPTMTLLIASQISARQALAEQRGLPEGKAETFSGDGVYSTRSVADQYGLATIHAPQSSRDGDRSPLVGGVFRIFEVCAKFGKFPERVFKPQLWATRNHGHTNFFVADGRGINLAVTAPVQFHEIGPGRDAVVAPEGEAQILLMGCIQLDPVTDARTGSVGAYHPACAQQFSRDQRAFRMQSGDRSLPQHANAARRRMIQQDTMQIRTPDPVRCSPRKHSLGLDAFANKTNAAKGIRFTFGNRDAELVQRLESVRHQSLAAGLVDRRNGAIRHHYAQTVTTSRDGRCQTGRSAADYKYIPRLGETRLHKSLGDEAMMRDFLLVPPTIRAKRTPSRTPAPSRPASRACRARGGDSS